MNAACIRSFFAVVHRSSFPRPSFINHQSSIIVSLLPSLNNAQTADQLKNWAQIVALIGGIVAIIGGVVGVAA